MFPFKGSHFVLAGQCQLGETKLMVVTMITKIGTAILNLGLSLQFFISSKECSFVLVGFINTYYLTEKLSVRETK